MMNLGYGKRKDLAEIQLLPVWKNKRPPYLNFSVCDFTRSQ